MDGIRVVSIPCSSCQNVNLSTELEPKLFFCFINIYLQNNQYEDYQMMCSTYKGKRQDPKGIIHTRRSIKATLFTQLGKRMPYLTVAR